jgi:hypothetical protein
VSEGRVKKPSDGYIWVQRWRDNHFLDCEAVAYAAACMLGVHRISDSAQRRRQEARPREPDMPVAKATTSVAAMARLNMGR